jgi:hypothetical protein
MKTCEQQLFLFVFSMTFLGDHKYYFLNFRLCRKHSVYIMLSITQYITVYYIVISSRRRIWSTPCSWIFWKSQFFAHNLCRAVSCVHTYALENKHIGPYEADCIISVINFGLKESVSVWCETNVLLFINLLVIFTSTYPILIWSYTFCCSNIIANFVNFFSFNYCSSW